MTANSSPTFHSAKRVIISRQVLAARAELIICPGFSNPCRDWLAAGRSIWGGRGSGIRLRFGGKSWNVILHAALFDIGLFRHVAFHHRFPIGPPLLLAILNRLRALTVCLVGCGHGSGNGGSRVWLGSLRKCGAMQDRYPSKRARDQKKVPLHPSTPVAVSRGTFLNAGQSGSRTKPIRTIRACSSDKLSVSEAWSIFLHGRLPCQALTPPY